MGLGGGPLGAIIGRYPSAATALERTLERSAFNFIG
jgi:hypothetical protein